MIISTGPVVLGYPPEISGYDFYSAQPSVETLTRLYRGEVKPFLAKSWEVGGDGKTIVINLEQGIKFHDGTDFNADAVKYNLELQKTAKKEEVARITSVDVIDNYKVRINLSQYDSALMYNFGRWPGMMVSPTAINAKGKEWARSNPVGSGPFKLIAFNRDASVKYERFGSYWQKGKPYLDAVQINYIKDPMTAAASFQAGEAQTYLGSASSQPKNGYDLEQKGFNVVKTVAAFSGLLPDSANPDSPYADKRVREAVEYALDRPAIVNALGYGFWNPLTQSAHPNTPYFVPDIKVRSYDIEKAKQLLAEAGYSKGFKTEILLAQAFMNKDAGVAVQRHLKDVGVDAQLSILDAAKWADIRKNGWKNGLAMTTLGNVLEPTQWWTNRDLPANATGYVSVARSKEYKDLINQALSEVNPEKQKALGQKIVKLQSDETMFIPLWTTSLYTAKQPGVHDDNNTQMWVGMYWTPEMAWIGK